MVCIWLRIWAEGQGQSQGDKMIPSVMIVLEGEAIQVEAISFL